jgi:DNA-directed RNA polymerase specialized sigma24 family protein
MTFEDIVVETVKFRHALGWHVSKKVGLEREDVEQTLLLSAWECYLEHSQSIGDDMKKYIMSSMSFMAKKIVSEEFKKMRRREKRMPKYLNLLREYEPDMSDWLLVRMMLDKFKQNLKTQDLEVCIMIENGYRLTEIGKFMNASVQVVSNRVKKIRKMYEKIMEDGSI